MKTYKLIKTYPGSFPLGHLAILDESVKYYNLGTTTRSLDYIENHPENWQHVCYKCHENVNTCKTFGCKQPLFITEDGVDIFEDKVVEKDYEILEVRGKYGAVSSYIEILDSDLKDKTIFKIKRLSDGEIFTIGDKVIGYNNSIAKIKTIDLVGEVSLNIGTDKHEGFSLKNLKKVKQPLFTTEDGVDIFEGDIFYSTRKDCSGCIIKYEGNFFEIASTKCKEFVDFSTKKAAENYIKMNKPCLSLNDVLSITNKTSFVPEDFSKNLIKKELTKIVKQKLK